MSSDPETAAEMDGIDPSGLKRLLEMVRDRTVSPRIAVEVILTMQENGGEPEYWLDQKGTAGQFPEVEFRTERGWVSECDLTDAERDKFLADLLGVKGDD